MPAENSSPSQGNVIDAVMKSKGLNLIDDLEADDEPLLQLQQHHELVIIVELCEATRPSKLGSLKGSHEKYEDEFSRLEGVLSELTGSGSIRLEKWTPGMQMAPAMPMPPPSSSRPSRPQSAGASRAQSRPQSASHLGRGAGAAAQARSLGLNNPERQQPRIGAFEVSYKLVNTTSRREYGPVEIFSKIQTGHWPGAASKLVNRVQERLQGFLAADVGDGMLFQHVSRCTPAQPPSHSRARLQLSMCRPHSRAPHRLAPKPASRSLVGQSQPLLCIPTASLMKSALHPPGLVSLLSSASPSLPRSLALADSPRAPACPRPLTRCKRRWRTSVLQRICHLAR